MAKPFNVKLRGLEGAIEALEVYRAESSRRVNRAIELTTNSAFRRVRREMRAPKGGREYKIGRRVYKASKPGEAPAQATRELYRSLFKRFRPGRGQVGTDDPEGIWLEFGALRPGNNLMQRRPWLRPAVNAERKPWRNRMFRALRASATAARRASRARQ